MAGINSNWAWESVILGHFIYFYWMHISALMAPQKSKYVKYKYVNLTSVTAFCVKIVKFYKVYKKIRDNIVG